MRCTAIWLALFMTFTFSCTNSEGIFTPKPRGYPKVVYPKKEYQTFQAEYCGFSFEYPVYTQIQQDTIYFDEKPANPCWFDIYYPAYDCRLHCSYYEIGRDKTFEELKTDAFELVDWHIKKANSIKEQAIDKLDGTKGFAFEIDGPAASPFQFYLSDSTQHFLRAAIYFNTQARPDSLAPIYQFVKADVMQMIESFEWGE